MKKKGPIVIIEDDPDDREILEQIFRELAMVNEVHYFDNGAAALTYLYQPKVNPFLLISDINMPGMNGFELRDTVMQDPELQFKCIPYLFLTTGSTDDSVKKAYTMSAQGIFAKPVQYKQFKALISDIVRYWDHCLAPFDQRFGNGN